MQQCNGFEALLFRKHRIQRLQVEEFKNVHLKQQEGAVLCFELLVFAGSSLWLWQSHVQHESLLLHVQK